MLAPRRRSIKWRRDDVEFETASADCCISFFTCQQQRIQAFVCSSREIRHSRWESLSALQRHASDARNSSSDTLEPVRLDCGFLIAAREQNHKGSREGRNGGCRMEKP